MGEAKPKPKATKTKRKAKKTATKAAPKKSKPPTSEQRKDGFNVERRAHFLSLLEQGHSWSTCAHKSGVSHVSAYLWKQLGAAYHGHDVAVPSGRKPTKTHGDFYTAVKEAEATAKAEFFDIARGHARSDPKTSVEMLKVLDERFNGRRAGQRLRRLEEEKKRQELKILRAKARVAEAAGKDGGAAIFLGVTALLDLDFFTPAFKDELREALCNGKIIAAVARDLANEPAIGEGP